MEQTNAPIGSVKSPDLNAANLPSGGSPLISSHPLVEKARRACIEDFSGKYRKVPVGSDLPRPPFSSHPHEVASILAKAGHGAEVVAAGYLHDHLEDLPKLWNKARIAKEFGETVAELVDWVTEQDKSLDWRSRKAAYAVRLEQAPADAVALSIADKICNLYDSIVYMRQGFPLESFLKRPWAEHSARLHEDLLPIFLKEGSNELVSQFVQALYDFDEIGAKQANTTH